MRHISYKPLWHTLLDKDMKKEDLRIAAGLTTNIIANMGKNKGISMETLEKICDALKCEITDVIELTDELPKEKRIRFNRHCLLNSRDGLLIENKLIVQLKTISQIKEIMIKAKQNVAAQTNNEQLLAYRNIGRIIVAHEFLSGLPKIPATDWNFAMGSLP